MSYRKPGPRVSATFVIYTLTAVALLALFPLYTNYKRAAAPLPPGVRLAGIAFPGVKDPAVMKEKFPKGWTEVKPYLRITPQPNR